MDSDARQAAAATVARRWAWTNPVRLAWRSLKWWRHTGDQPWRQQLVGLAFIEPSPLDDALIAGLMTKEPR